MIKAFILLLGLAGMSPELDGQSDRVSSFRDIVWGSYIDSVMIDGAEVKFERSKGSDFDNAYEIFNDKMMLGNVEMNQVNYIFNEEGRFYKVYLKGRKDQTEEMKFILEYKFGSPDNTWKVDELNYTQWIIADVTFTLAEHEFHTFDLVIESDWQAAEAYRKNTSVEDF